jgi:hypothetical protein
VLQIISVGVVSAPAHLLPPLLVKRVAVPVQREVSSVVYPMKPVLVLGVPPAGAVQVVGEALVPVYLSILLLPSVKGGSFDFTVTV